MQFLKSSSQRFDENIADDRGDRGDFKVGGGEDVSERPGEAFLLANARVFKFSHEEIGIEQEDDESDFNRRSQGIFLYGHGLAKEFAFVLPLNKYSAAAAT